MSRVALGVDGIHVAAALEGKAFEVRTYLRWLQELPWLLARSTGARADSLLKMAMPAEAATGRLWAGRAALYPAYN